MKSDLGSCKEQTGENSQDIFEKVVGDISPTRYYMFYSVHTMSTRINRWIKGEK